MLNGYKKVQSLYELKNIVWIGLEYDKEKLIHFLDRIQLLKSKKDKESKEELSKLLLILDSYDSENLNKLLQNDEIYSKWATIEKWARKASLEILIDGKYSKETFQTISNLPIVDYQLVVKRSKELIKIINDTLAEVEVNTSLMPGVK